MFLPFWIAYGFYYAWPAKTLGLVFAYMPIGGVLLTLGCYALLVRPLRRLSKLSREDCEPWRDRWRSFERQSNELKFRVTQTGRSSGLDPEDDMPSRWAPAMPAVSLRLTDRREFQVGSITLPDGADLEARANGCSEAILSYMLLELVGFGGRSVVGTNEFDGQHCLCGCFMMGQRAQLWVLFSVRRVGNMLSVNIVTGHQWWIHPCELSSGAWYKGDVERSRLNLVMPHNFFGAAAILVGMFLYPMAALGYAMLVAFAVYAIAHEIYHRDFERQMRRAYPVGSGDSTDYQLLADARASKPRWTQATLDDHTLADIETLTRRLFEAARRAATLRGVVS
jgi:hypothetical protein